MEQHASYLDSTGRTCGQKMKAKSRTHDPNLEVISGEGVQFYRDSKRRRGTIRVSATQCRSWWQLQHEKSIQFLAPEAPFLFVQHPQKKTGGCCSKIWIVSSERDAAQHSLAHVIGDVPEFSCPKHSVKKYCNRAITNVYLNNKRKITTANVRKDDVKQFKKSKRTKNWPDLDYENGYG